MNILQYNLFRLFESLTDKFWVSVTQCKCVDIQLKLIDMLRGRSMGRRAVSKSRSVQWVKNVEA